MKTKQFKLELDHVARWPKATEVRKPLTHEQALRLNQRHKLAEGQTCGSCVNYIPYCRKVLSGEKPLSPDTTDCYWTINKYNVPIAGKRR